MARRNIVVIGGSAGAIEALRQLLPDFPSNFHGSIFIALHIAEDSSHPRLAEVLGRHTGLPCEFAVDHAPISPGRIYVAPPGRHMTLTNTQVRIVDGPRENGFRPAIDPLFRTAAMHHGAAVVGVLLSGACDDGSAGLATIKQFGGRAIVQAPADCTFPSMPESALALVQADDVVPASEMIPHILARTKETTGAPVITAPSAKGPDRGPGQGKEVDMSITGRDDHDPRVRSWDAFVCPDCGGVLRELAEGPMQRFQCRTGHAYNIESLLASQAEGVEAALWFAVNVLREREDMSRRLADHSTRRGMQFAAKRYLREAQTSVEQAEKIVDVLKLVGPLPPERTLAHGGKE